MAREVIAIVGAGILGLAIGRELTRSRPDAKVIVLEKEDRVAAHQTGHNSGVVHAGIYYQPGSLKAELCRTGRELLRDYCIEHSLPYQECGKLVIAVTEDEVGRLDPLADRATANAVPGLRRLTAAEIQEIEPHATGLAALHSPHTAITDYPRIAETLAAEIRAAGGQIHLNQTVKSLHQTPTTIQIQTTPTPNTAPPNTPTNDPHPPPTPNTHPTNRTIDTAQANPTQDPSHAHRSTDATREDALREDPTPDASRADGVTDGIREDALREDPTPDASRTDGVTDGIREDVPGEDSTPDVSRTDGVTDGLREDALREDPTPGASRADRVTDGLREDVPRVERVADGVVHPTSDASGVERVTGEVRVEATSDVHRAGCVIEGHRVSEADREQAAGDVLCVDRVIVCAGLQSDRVARLAGDVAGPRIVPFRGEYLVVAPEKADLVRGLIYPVPDPRYPFLGVHFTRRVSGEVEVGPNAVLAFAREGYRRSTVSLRDVGSVAAWPGFWRMAARHWRTGIREIHGSLSIAAYLRDAARYVPEIGVADVARGGAGVRAQALDANGQLVDDFRIHHLGRITAIRNAPSPAATSSLAIAQHVIATLTD